MDINTDLLQCSMIYKFFDKKSVSLADKSASGSSIKNENISNKELDEESHKPVIRKFKKIKVHSPFIDNICGADLADTQLPCKFNKGICFLLCVFNIFNKYTWVIPLKDQKVITIANAFKKILDESNQKPNKTWPHKGSKVYNRSMK